MRVRVIGAGLAGCEAALKLADEGIEVDLFEQKPKRFDDLIAINALIRPGVGDFKEYVLRRNGKSFNIF